MLKSKIIHLNKIYKFGFYHFLIKRTVFGLSIKNCFYKIKKSIFRLNYERCEKILRRKIVHLKGIYKFGFDDFLEKRIVFVLSVNNGFYKFKISIFRPNYARFEKMLRSKIVHLKKIYKFDSYHFLIKRTIFVLIDKKLLKIIKKTVVSGQTMQDTKKMLRSKIIQLKKIYKFYFDHFLIKRTVFILSIKNGFYKIKKSSFRLNYARFEKILRSKIIQLEKIYNFHFDNFLVKRTLFVLSINNCFYKIKKSIFQPNCAKFEKMLRSKIVHLKKIYKFYFYHCLIKRTVFVLSIKNCFYKIKKSIFRLNYAEIMYTNLYAVL